MPKLWNDTIETHRQAVREATLDTAAELVLRLGIPAVTMSLIAKETGIGRATLYKYFPDVEAILIAWHERQITQHLQQIVEVAGRIPAPRARVVAVLEAYAFIVHAHHGSSFAASLHRRLHAQQAEHTLHRFVSGLIAEAGAAGEMRIDVAADELAHFALAGLAAASRLPNDLAVKRLVAIILDKTRGGILAYPCPCRSVDALGEADQLWPFALIGELGRVLQNLGSPPRRPPRDHASPRNDLREWRLQAALVFAQSEQARGIVWPIAPPIWSKT